MIPKYRQAFNASFSNQSYLQLRQVVENTFQQKLGFRLLETPIFLPKDVVQQLQQASLSIIKQLKQNSFRKEADHAIPHEWLVPNEDEHPIFLQFDFALTLNKKHKIEPQLIELQGFPALFFFQIAAQEGFKSISNLDNLHPYYDKLNQQNYLKLLRQNILGKHHQKNVVLLEHDPWNQKTAIDFAGAQQLLNIPVIDIRTIQRKNKRLFYKNKKGLLTPIYRIFNRVIFDELAQYNHQDWDFNLTQEVDVEWAGHPNWFLKYSKFALPYIQGAFAPKSIFLDQWNGDTNQLKNSVLKPIFSFSGNGVHIHPTKEIIAQIPNKKQYILQEKITYAPLLESPQGHFSQVEVRVMLIQNPNKKGEYIFMTNLVRAGREGIIGTQHQQKYDWTGGGIGLMEE